jgi:hypothetical protein
MKTKGSLSSSQQPATFPYPEQEESSSHLPIYLEDSFQFKTPIYAYSFHVDFFS